MALEPPPYDHEEWDWHWRQWISRALYEAIEPAPGGSTDNSNTPHIITTPTYLVDNLPTILICDTDSAGSDITVTMLAASRATNVYHVKKIGTSGDVIVDGNASETIDGGVIATITLENESMMIVSDNTKWYVI